MPDSAQIVSVLKSTFNISFLLQYSCEILIFFSHNSLGVVHPLVICNCSSIIPHVLTSCVAHSYAEFDASLHPSDHVAIGFLFSWFLTQALKKGWVWTHDSPASTSTVLGLQAFINIPVLSPALHCRHMPLCSLLTLKSQVLVLFISPPLLLRPTPFHVYPTFLGCYFKPSKTSLSFLHYEICT